MLVVQKAKRRSLKLNFSSNAHWEIGGAWIYIPLLLVLTIFVPIVLRESHSRKQLLLSFMTVEVVAVTTTFRDGAQVALSNVKHVMSAHDCSVIERNWFLVSIN